MPLSIHVEEDLKEIMHFLYMTYIATPCTRAPALEGMKFTILVDPSLIIITHTIHLPVVCLNHAPKQRRRFIRYT